MKLLPAAAAVSMLFAACPAAAQLALPGSVAPSPPGTVVKLQTAHKTVAGPKAAAAYTPPGVATVIGRTLLQNGANGQMQFSGRAEDLHIDRFTMVGEVISDPKQQCRIDVGGGAQIAAKGLGRPDGLLRYSADIPACPFEFDILDGAILAPPQLRACVFQAADCQASPSGLWGPAGTALTTTAKPIEHARALAEAAMTANYRALDARLKDRTKADDLARDQARFSSDREETCRDYAKESAHSFCATRLTEARAAFLKARTDELPVEVASKAPSVKRHKHKPSQ